MKASAILVVLGATFTVALVPPDRTIWYPDISDDIAPTITAVLNFNPRRARPRLVRYRRGLLRGQGSEAPKRKR